MGTTSVRFLEFCCKQNLSKLHPLAQSGPLTDKILSTLTRTVEFETNERDHKVSLQHAKQCRSFVLGENTLLHTIIEELEVTDASYIFFYKKLARLQTYLLLLFEPPREKTNNLHRRKQSNCEADQRLCFRYSDRTNPLLRNPKFQASPALFCACTARFVSDLFVNHIVGFPTRRLFWRTCSNVRTPWSFPKEVH